MKNKKGFTLVELLGTLVVLSVILMIAYPLVTSYVKNTKQKAYDTQMEIMLTSLRNHANEYKDILPINDKEYVLLKLGQLKGLGVIKNSVINPLNGEEIEDSMEFKISKEGTRYVYEILEDTIETRASKDSSPSIELIGNPLEYYEVGAVYEEKGVKAYDYNGNSLDITTTTTLDMNTHGIYTILYSVIDENNIKSYAYRTIIVGSIAEESVE